MWKGFVVTYSDSATWKMHRLHFSIRSVQHAVASFLDNDKG